MAKETHELVEELLERVVDALGLNATVEVIDDDETVTGSLHGDDLGLFIGRHGQTIEAVQHLAYRIAVHGGDGERKRIVIDAEGYRARREEALHRQADQAADDAVRYKRPVALDAMTASERKLVHEYLRDRGDVTGTDAPRRALRSIQPAAAGLRPVYRAPRPRRGRAGVHHLRPGPAARRRRACGGLPRRA
jgi:spoIIIJ-associated protein